jgi:hypothetical protein
MKPGWAEGLRKTQPRAQSPLSELDTTQSRHRHHRHRPIGLTSTSTRTIIIQPAAIVASMNASSTAATTRPNERQSQTAQPAVALDRR